MLLRASCGFNQLLLLACPILVWVTAVQNVVCSLMSMHVFHLHTICSSFATVRMTSFACLGTSFAAFEVLAESPKAGKEEHF
jgi:hypothetical protein